MIVRFEKSREFKGDEVKSKKKGSKHEEEIPESGVEYGFKDNEDYIFFSVKGDFKDVKKLWVKINPIKVECDRDQGVNVTIGVNEPND